VISKRLLAVAVGHLTALLDNHQACTMRVIGFACLQAETRLG
jgi:hypothetical protein